MNYRPRLAVCSWSLRPDSPEDLVAKVRATGLDRVQLALRPLVEGRWRAADVRAALGAAGVAIESAMFEPLGEDYATPATIRRTGGVVPDGTWEANLVAARAAVAHSLALGVGLVTFHAGFVPEAPGPDREKLCARLRTLHDLFASARVRVALETGQETASGLLDALEEIGRPALGVNFDPANLILYGTDEPIAALRRLASRVAQVHVKDALPPRTPGSWGEEVPVGAGAVPWEEFFAVLRAGGRDPACVVEREAGEARVEDVRTAAALVRRIAGRA